ncbi:MAG TPA: PHP domain-containing protein [Elusimicrobiota bacterium]|nr:PHP domain-containing protein [Elusimicrobiota bacterium]
MPSRTDLHTHTTASDGTLTPEELFDKAAGLGVRVLAITDHDSTNGYDALQPLRSRHPDVRLVPGIEMSAEGDKPCHLLGYFINPTGQAFQTSLRQLRDKRVERVRAMADKLGQLGIELDWSRIVAQAKGGCLGRPHLADALLERRIVKTRQEAFDRFLKRNGPAYVAQDEPRSRQTIELIRNAGGVAVLAHPSYDTSEELLKALVSEGLNGIEAYYPDHSRSLTQRYLEMAKDLQLVVTGGSDFHGPRTGRTALASVTVPEDVLEILEKRSQNI